jgi:hypothetical protein
VITYCGIWERTGNVGAVVAVGTGDVAVGSAVSGGNFGSCDEATTSNGVGVITFSGMERVLQALRKIINVMMAHRGNVSFIAASYHEALENCRMKYNQSYYFYGGGMKISWYGHTCFRLVSRGLASVVTDPYDHTVVGNVFITAVRTNGKKRNTDELRNTLYVFDFDGISVAHLGNMRRVPSQSRIEALGTINIALVPIGGKDGLNAAKAVEVISLLEPGIVIPMLYSTSHSKLELDPLDKFLKEMGLGQLKAEKELDITSSAIPTETRVVVLDYEI